MKSLEPKLEFLKSPTAADFAELINNPLVKNGIRVALEQFVQDQPRHDDFNGATKAQYELQGAKRYISTLLNLTEPDEQPKATPSGILQCQPRQSRQQPPQQSKPQK